MLKWLYKVCAKKHNLSVIVPTYNNVNYLAECIDSIIRSAKIACKQYEILVGIDNCHDTLQFISRRHRFSNKNVRFYFFPKNVGPYIIRNSLALISKYDNILFFDSDDVMMKDALNTILNKFNNKEILKFKFYNFFDGKDYNDVENLSISSIFSHGAFLIKRNKFLDMNGFFGWKCGADAEFEERYRNVNHNIPTLDIPLFYRRYHNTNITRSDETGIGSRLRNRYGKIINDNRINGMWKNPVEINISKFYQLYI